MKNKHQLEIMSRYLAFLSFGAKNAGLTEESNRAGAAAQLLQWACDQRNASTEALDENYQKAKSAFRQLKKDFPDVSHAELMDMLPGYLMEEAMKNMVTQPNNQ
jgi:hypothetical protein